METLETDDFTIRELRNIVQKASRDNPHLTSRLEKAAFLVLLRPIEPLGDHHFRVMSEDGLRYYEVINGHCQCHDYVRHGSGHPCKHRLALAMSQRLDSFGPPSPSPKGSTPAIDALEAKDVRFGLDQSRFIFSPDRPSRDLGERPS